MGALRLTGSLTGAAAVIAALSASPTWLAISVLGIGFVLVSGGPGLRDFVQVGVGSLGLFAIAAGLAGGIATMLNLVQIEMISARTPVVVALGIAAVVGAGIAIRLNSESAA